jgi:SAM-dependent methyltransferase
MDERERIAGRALFGEAAGAYDAVRPGYPARVVDLLIARAALGGESHVLEIGCGTGQLTRDLAPTGCAILALEPDRELAQLARRNFSGFPKVQIREEPFEWFEVGVGTFDLVVAATSFHWLDPQVRCNKAHRALRPRGTLGILTNEHPTPWTGFFERVQDIYRAVAPALATAGMASKQRSNELIREINSSGLFSPVETLSERWERRFNRDEYLALLHTYSPHRQLPDHQRLRLFAAIGKLIDEEYEGYVNQPYSTSLCLARMSL